MTLGLLHQVGHNSSWNVESFQDDGNGDGLILSPLHQAKGTVEKLPLSTRQVSLFDPQFYLPSSRKKKLLSYPFFPEQVDGGFRTATFGTHVNEVAQRCIEFQVEQQFRKVVVPTRFLDQMYPHYFEMQNQFTVDAFMLHSGDLPLCLSVAVTDHMIQDPAWRRYMLNWITSFPAVDEVYLMYQHERDLKQVQDPEFLREALRFFTDVLDSGLKLTIGYTNCEGILFSVAGDLNITMGAFENTRVFSVDKFLESEGERRGPKARIYLPGLFNWVQFEDAKRIRDQAPGIWRQVYSPTIWAEEALARDVEPTFNQPPLYKHYFTNMQMQVEQLQPMSPLQRRSLMIQQVESAQAAYRELHWKGVQLEKHGQASHLAGWLEALRTPL
jgi:hypothetical protein